MKRLRKLIEYQFKNMLIPLVALIAALVPLIYGIVKAEHDFRFADKRLSVKKRLMLVTLRKRTWLSSGSTAIALITAHALGAFEKVEGSKRSKRDSGNLDVIMTNSGTTTGALAEIRSNQGKAETNAQAAQSAMAELKASQQRIEQGLREGALTHEIANRSYLTNTYPMGYAYFSAEGTKITPQIERWKFLTVDWSTVSLVSLTKDGITIIQPSIRSTSGRGGVSEFYGNTLSFSRIRTNKWIISGFGDVAMWLEIVSDNSLGVTFVFGLAPNKKVDRLLPPSLPPTAR